MLAGGSVVAGQRRWLAVHQRLRVIACAHDLSGEPTGSQADHDEPDEVHAGDLPVASEA